jgi:hypothetical protein
MAGLQSIGANTPSTTFIEWLNSLMPISKKLGSFNGELRNPVKQTRGLQPK